MILTIDLSLTLSVNTDDVSFYNLSTGSIDNNLSDEDKFKTFNETTDKYCLSSISQLIETSDIYNYEILLVEEEKD